MKVLNDIFEVLAIACKIIDELDLYFYSLSQ